MKESSELVVGAIEVAGGTTLYFSGLSTQVELLEAAEISVNQLATAYTDLVEQYSKPVVDTLVSVGEDLGAVLIVLGLSKVISTIKPEWEDQVQQSKIGLLTYALVKEICQFAGLAKGTPSLVDLVIFAIPLATTLIQMRGKD